MPRVKADTSFSIRLDVRGKEYETGHSKVIYLSCSFQPESKVLETRLQSNDSKIFYERVGYSDVVLHNGVGLDFHDDDAAVKVVTDEMRRLQDELLLTLSPSST